MKTIVLDLETTGLLKPFGTDLFLQPHIIEIAALQLNKNDKIIKEAVTLIKPPISIPYHITKLTGIDDEMVKNKPSFVEIYKEFTNFFIGCETLVAHGISFDEGVLIIELQRIGKEYYFPYAPKKFCTIEQSMHLKGRRLKNSELYEIITGRQIKEAHRAINDVRATCENYKGLKNVDKHKD